MNAITRSGSPVTPWPRDRWRALGRWYGYPPCCVDEFCGGELGHRPRKFDGTGFVPCASCHEHKSEGELLEEIAARRLCPTEFPDEGVRRFEVVGVEETPA